MGDEIGVGMIGYEFMGRAHSAALQRLTALPHPPALTPRLVALAGRTAEKAAAAAQRLGWEGHTTDWRELIADERIGLLDNAGPNAVHAEPSIAAAEAGKHVICEKPLGRDADESLETWRRVAATGVVHMCAFNYRFVPAVRLAREILEAGDLGEIHHFRVRYLQSWGGDPAAAGAWRFDPETAGSGALGDLGTHAIDLARYLVGEPRTVAGATATFVPGRGVDDALAATVEFEGGAIGTLEATRFATGRINSLAWEVNGSRGALAFDMERMNELRVAAVGTEPVSRAQGFRTVLVTGPDHPWSDQWWPPGHILGWDSTFVHELHHLFAAIAGEQTVAPHGATFEDGYRADEVGAAIVESARTGARVNVSYRGLDS
jgi:predicted dehydrogenase